MPDPKLQTAMEEIKTILKKYDIAANVLLASPTHMEFLREFKTSWSMIYVKPGGIRIRCTRKDFPDAATFKRATEITIGTIAGFADACRNEADQMIRILQAIGKSGVEFDHRTIEEKPE